MSATLQNGRPPSPEVAAPGPCSSTLALGRIEGRRLLRHPLVLVGVELSLFLHLRTVVVSGQVPVVPRDDVAIVSAMLPVAVATLLATNWAALRSRRHGMRELDATLPMTPGQRTVAHLLSVAAPVGLAAMVVITNLGLLVVLGGTGRPGLELFDGPAVVALAGALGVLLARLAPWMGAAPVTAIGFAASWYFPYLWFRTTGQVRIWGSLWLFPWFGASRSPADVTGALAAGWHLAYVSGLIGVAACLALALSPTRHRVQATSVLAAVLALAIAGASAVAGVSPPTPAHQDAAIRVASGAPEAQVCRPKKGVRYCTWPAYRSWIDGPWRPPVAGVLGRLPAAGRGRVLRVRQMDFDALALCWYRRSCPPGVEKALDDGDVRPGSSWPRGRGQDRAELGLAASVGAWAVGLPTAPKPGTLTICMPREAASVVALLLAGESTPKAGERLTTLTLGQPSQERRTEASLPPRSRLTLGSDALGSDSIVVEWPWQEAAYAAKLLRLPAVRVAAELHEHWQRWVSRGTPTAELVAAFGLPPLPTPDTAAQDCAE